MGEPAVAVFLAVRCTNWLTAERERRAADWLKWVRIDDLDSTQQDFRFISAPMLVLHHQEMSGPFIAIVVCWAKPKLEMNRHDRTICRLWTLLPPWLEWLWDSVYIYPSLSRNWRDALLFVLPWLDSIEWMTRYYGAMETRQRSPLAHERRREWNDDYVDYSWLVAIHF